MGGKLRGVQSQRRTENADGTSRDVAQRRVGEVHGLDKGRVSEDILLVSTEESGIVIDTVAGPDSGFAGAERVPGNSHARREVSGRIIGNITAKRRIFAA